jgi:hypothetical protein
MTLAALQHLVQAAHALAGDRTFLVLGSASLLFLDIPVELKPRVLANFKHTLD